MTRRRASRVWLLDIAIVILIVARRAAPAIAAMHRHAPAFTVVSRKLPALGREINEA